MLEKLNYRFPITDEILIGTLLDPRLQNLPRLDSELNKRNTTKFEFLKREILKIVPTSGTSKSNSTENSVSPNFQQTSEDPQTSKCMKKKNETSLLTELIKKHAYQSRENQDPTNLDSKVDQEIHKYFLTIIPEEEVDGFNILAFWKDHKSSLPLLGELVKKFLCIPVTSTSSERAFSYAGILISAKRSSLSPYVVEKTLFVHDNYELVKKELSIH